MKSFLSKFLSEFKEFALKGNVMDMAVGVIIGAAFGDIITAFTNDFINPIIGCIGGAEFHGTIPLIAGQAINYGHFISAIINFIIMAFAIFLMVKAVNTLTSLGKKKNEEAPAPTTKICPYCLSEIPIKAKKCAFCASLIDVEETAEEN